MPPPDATGLVNPGRSLLLAGSATAVLPIMGTAADHTHGSHQHGAAVHASPALTGDSGAGYRQFVHEMHEGMDKMMRDMHADPPSGDPDVDFLVMMIPHHAGAVEMARLVLRHGKDSIVREIAELILAAQVGEIAGMQGRLALMRHGVNAYPALTGNRGSS